MQLIYLFQYSALVLQEDIYEKQIEFFYHDLFTFSNHQMVESYNLNEVFEYHCISISLLIFARA